MLFGWAALQLAHQIRSRRNAMKQNLDSQHLQKHYIFRFELGKRGEKKEASLHQTIVIVTKNTGKIFLCRSHDSICIFHFGSIDLRFTVAARPNVFLCAKAFFRINLCKLFIRTDGIFPFAGFCCCYKKRVYLQFSPYHSRAWCKWI